MPKTNWKKVAELVKSTPVDALKKAIDVDGHSIYDPSKFIEAGLDPVVVEAFTEVQKSDGTPKGTIFSRDWEILPTLKGVYGLNLLEFIAQQFGVTSDKMGRGFRAADLQKQLLAKWSIQWGEY
jgi:hypothetical protein